MKETSERISIKTYSTFVLISIAAGLALATFIWFFGKHFGFVLKNASSYFILLGVLAAGGFVVLIFLRESERRLKQEEVVHTQRILEIANKTLPYLRTGLSMESAHQVARIIYERTDAIAVAITDLSKVLAFNGVGADHHTSGESILTRSIIKE